MKPSLTTSRFSTFFLAISYLAFVFSCEDEMERPHRSGRIKFIPDLWPATSPLSKGDAPCEETTPANTVAELRADGLGTLYLHTLYGDRIVSRFRRGWNRIACR